MDLLSAEHLAPYWSGLQWQANVLMLLHLLGATALGLALGYERAYHGRAAGMRTYALVCTASCAATILVAYPLQWFGGHTAGGAIPQFIDPTRVIQGVLTGIGFLCAGVIMREGMNISGLTTAASLWVAERGVLPPRRLDLGPLRLMCEASSRLPDGLPLPHQRTRLVQIRDAQARA